MITQMDAEKLLVAFCLQGRDAIRYVADTYAVGEDDISDTHLKMIFGSCVALYSQRKEVDALAVQGYLRESVHASHFAGKDKQMELEILQTLCSDIAADFNFLKQLASPITACQFLKKEAQRRRVMEKIFTLSDKLQSGTDVEETLDAGISDLISLSHSLHNITQRNYVSLDDAIREAGKKSRMRLPEISLGFRRVCRRSIKWYTAFTMNACI